MPTLMRYF